MIANLSTVWTISVPGVLVAAALQSRKMRCSAHFIVQCRQKTTLISLLCTGGFD